MDKFIPQNLDPMSEVIQRVRSLNNPDMNDIDCQTMEKRFYDQDWMTQLDMYETWLDIDNSYTINVMYRYLCSGYWELLQELISERKSERAKSIADRIEQYSIKHIRMQMVAFFITNYMPIDVVRKYKKTLNRYIDAAYLSFAERLAGDADFVIEKDRLVPSLAYYNLCDKFNLPTTDEEALSDFIGFMDQNWMQLSYDFPQDEFDVDLRMSLMQNADIKRWYDAICNLGLKRTIKTIECFDKVLQTQISLKFKDDVSCIEFPGLPMERQIQYWYRFRKLANIQMQINNNLTDVI